MMAPVNPVVLRPARGSTVRAATSAAEITAASCFAHWCAGGTLPSAPWVVGYAAILMALGMGLHRGTVTPAWAFVGASAGQLFVHLCLQTAAPAGHTHDGGAWPMVVAHVAGAVATVVIWSIRRRAWDVLVRVRRVCTLVLRAVSAPVEPAGGVSGIDRWIAARHRAPPVGC